MHVRQVIRNAVLTKLRGATAAGDRVHDNWTVAPQASYCPFIVVETGQSQVQPSTLMGEQMRAIAIDAVLFAAAQETVADVLDALAAEVETALGDSLGVGEIDFEFTGDLLDVERAGPGEVAALRMRFVCRVETDGPETILA